MCAAKAVKTSPPTHTVIEYFYPPELDGHRCGYCKSPNTNYTNGIWAHAMSPENYENLINIGWRRSGCYVYKPMNEKICCPMYTIRNLSAKVEISRGQRKVLKKFKKYLSDDIVPGSGGGGGGGGDGHEKKKGGKEGNESGEERMNECLIENGFGSKPKVDVSVQESKDTMSVEASKVNLDVQKASPVPVTSTASTATEKKAHPLKRKFLRRERKRQKLLAKGMDPDEFFKRNERNRVIELGEFFKNGQDYKHQFTTKLVQVDDEEDFTEEIFKLEHSLYQKYQMKVHGDTEQECRPSQFRRFLCENPFGSHWPQKPTPLGLYHQHYYIDSKLIAVGVVDILPHCVSSVYFFYDPDLSFLSPGTLGALHEIYFVNELNQKNPALRYYYLGFYIHTCVKMRYKRKFRPCELVCPITLQWVKFDDRVVSILDNQKFARLHDGDDVVRGEQDVTKALLLYNRSIYPFSMYPKKYEQLEELQSYVNLVSSDIASNMLLYRSGK